MATQQTTSINGIDTAQLQAFIDAMQTNPEAGRLALRTRSRWDDGAAVDGSGDAIEIRGEVLARTHHTFRADFPHELGGGDTGPAPGEALLAALGSCIAGSYVEKAALLEIEIEELEVALDARVDLRGAYEIDSVRARPSEIHVTLRVRADADDETLAALGRTARRTSPVADSLVDSIPLRVSVQRLD